MPQQFKLNTIKDFAALTPEQFDRMLPDFIAWHQYIQGASQIGFMAVGFIWVDDGLAGEIHSVSIHDTATGTTYATTGPATQPQGSEGGDT